MSTATISTKGAQNWMTLNDLQRVASTIYATRNSKHRPMPLHIVGPPGGAKTSVAEEIARDIARSMPGVPFGFSAYNVGNCTPADIAGFTLFETVKYHDMDDSGHVFESERKVSRFTVPTVFAFAKVFIFDPDSNRIITLTKDAFGQPLYVGSTVVHGGMMFPVMHGIILLDEFLQADIEARKPCAPLLDEGRVASHYLPPGVAVWCASNRVQDKSGVGRGLAFLTNRVCTINIRYDAAGFLAYLRGIGLDAQNLPAHITPAYTYSSDDSESSSESITNPRLAAAWAKGERVPAHVAITQFTEQNADLLGAGVPDDPNAPFLTQRSLSLVSNLLDQMLVDHEDLPIRFAQDPDRCRLFTALASGIIGDDATAHLNGVINLFDEIPTLAEILASPTKAKVSERKDAQMLIASMISQAMTIPTGNAFCQYLRRLNDAFYKNSILLALQREPGLTSCSEVSKLFAADPYALGRMLHARSRSEAAQQRNQGRAR